ncbi:MAG TPA: Holliday junction branch migration protein RuvA [Acidimicrobiales bacterium]|nr:Holliday junction branch migration protein RuvA [Acidimicrobiales bacterium]
MIAALRGRLVALEPSGESAVSLVLDVNGVGYAVTVGARQAAALAPVGQCVELAVHTHVREGAIALYGFADHAERRCFEVLLGAHGVGPALALAILSVHTPATLARAVAEGDLDALTLVPGVGRKTAQRLVVDLASRMGAVSGREPVPVGHGGDDAARADVREALAALGYAPDEVRAALASLPEAGTTEELLRRALAALAPAR